jgi:hypothetical protein
MAITIFSKASGVVATFPDPTLPAVTTLRMENWGGFQGFKSIITSVNIAAQGNFQFLHTLGGNIYVYVFGDRIGQLGISGLAFDSTCDDTTGALGIEKVLDYYSKNRLAVRKTPIKTTIGVQTTVAGYLVGVGGQVVDPKSRIYQFNLQFMLAPTNTLPCSVSSDDSSGGDEDEEATAPNEDPFAGSTSPDDYQWKSAAVSNNGSYITGNGQMTAGGYNSFGTGPNIDMVLPQVI